MSQYYYLYYWYTTFNNKNISDIMYIRATFVGKYMLELPDPCNYVCFTSVSPITRLINETCVDSYRCV